MVESRLVRDLKNHLELECKVQEQYLALLETEQKAMIAFDTDKVTQCADKREDLNQKISDLQSERIDLIKNGMEMINQAGKDPVKLTVFVEKHCPPQDQRILRPIVQRLKALMTKTHGKVKEYGMVADFNLGMVSSTLSILFSGTQDQTPTYNQSGQLKTGYTPAGNPELGVLRTA